MTMFVHHAIVHCGEDRCWHGDGHCAYIRFWKDAAARCELFACELNTVPGTGALARCKTCLLAEGRKVEPVKVEREKPMPCCDWCRHWGPPCNGPTHSNICHKYEPKP
jgi:hypothetical protein